MTVARSSSWCRWRSRRCCFLVSYPPRLSLASSGAGPSSHWVDRTDLVSDPSRVPPTSSHVADDLRPVPLPPKPDLLRKHPRDYGCRDGVRMLVGRAARSALVCGVLLRRDPSRRSEAESVVRTGVSYVLLRRGAMVAEDRGWR